MAAPLGKPAHQPLAAQAEARPVRKAQSFMLAALALQMAFMAMAAVAARPDLLVQVEQVVIAPQAAAGVAALMAAVLAAMVMEQRRVQALAALALMVVALVAQEARPPQVIPACRAQNTPQRRAARRARAVAVVLRLVLKAPAHHLAALAGFMVAVALERLLGPARTSGAMAAKALSLLPMFRLVRLGRFLTQALGK
jgi:hypothetical protein